jgi:Uncharacterized protein conserved in bacteria (DUF2237)
MTLDGRTELEGASIAERRQWQSRKSAWRIPQRAWRAARSLLHNPDDGVLSGRMLQYGTSGYRQPHGLRRNDCCVSRFFQVARQRSFAPVPELGFPGLQPGDRWCLCASRWHEAFEAGQAPRVVLRATHEAALADCSLADLKRHAVDLA